MSEENKNIKVQIEFDHLGEIIRESVEQVSEEAVNSAIKEEIINLMKETGVEDRIKEIIEAKLVSIVDDVFENHKLVVGGDPYQGIAPQEFTFAEFAERELLGILKDGKLKVKDSRGYSTTVEPVEYLIQKMDIDGKVERKIDEFTGQVKRQVELNIKNTFDDSMKNVISNNLLQILQSQEAYKNIYNGIRGIANGQ